MGMCQDLTSTLNVFLFLYFVVHTYEVTVFTGDHWAAETDANLYITIFGSQGDTGKRMLYNSTTNQVKYRTGQVCIVLYKCRY